jgi:aryl-alcohol dehydrogenase-like predicted oxidoreductase
MKLGLGTAQFGSDYGISNRQGKTPLCEVKKILAFAASKGITVVDTAAMYGTSEEVLGIVLSAIDPFSVITKTQQFDRDVITASEACQLEATFFRSLQRLNRSKIYALLAHRTGDLFLPGGELLFEKMLDLKEQGLVCKVGVSVYNGQQIDDVLSRYAVDIIQLPLNVFDQRLIASGHLEKLKAAGIEVHARSAFLQGLLLMDPEALPASFSAHRKHIQRYHEYLRRQGLSPLCAALRFILDIKEVDFVICGVNTLSHLQEICSSVQMIDSIDLSSFCITDIELLDPSQWVLTG